MGRICWAWIFGMLAVSCGQHHDNRTEKGSFPTRLGGNGDATVEKRAGTYTAGSHLIVSLARPARPGEDLDAACWPLPEADTGFGLAVCESDGALKVELTKAYVDVTCGSNPIYAGLKATTTLDTAACGSYAIFAYSFDPALTWSVDSGETLPSSVP